MSSRYSSITKMSIARYSARFASLGEDVKSLGWGSVEQQTYRFSRALNIIDGREKTFLDIGCGFGDMLGYAKDIGYPIKKYTGWDINEEFINVARSRYPNETFEVVDLSAENYRHDHMAQIGSMLGVLNFNLGEVSRNIEYSKFMIKTAFGLVSETLVVDFLSSYTTPSYEPESFVFYHKPEEMLQYALELSPNVELIHSYQPIPQKEFMLVLSHV